MLRSLFSGISGLRSHQTMLDVTGNNIANVNTTGFKASQIQFQDTLSQMLNAASDRRTASAARTRRRSAWASRSPASPPTSRRAPRSSRAAAPT